MKPEEIKKLSLLERMMMITNEVKKVTKNLQVGTGRGSYKAVAEEDILDAIKELEFKYRIYSYPIYRELVDIEKQKKIVIDYDGNEKEVTIYYAKVKTTYKFCNVDNQESIDMISFSEAIDTGDKGFGKAQTYGDKYALMKAYKIPTGNDPDKDPSPQIEETQSLTLDKAKEYIVNYKKHKGKTFEEVYKEDKQYIEWLMKEGKATPIVIKCYELLKAEEEKDVPDLTSNPRLEVLKNLLKETKTGEASIYTHFEKKSLYELENAEIEESIKTLENKKASLTKGFKLEDVELKDEDMPF